MAWDGLSTLCHRCNSFYPKCLYIVPFSDKRVANVSKQHYDKTFLKTQIQRASDVPRTDALIKTNQGQRLKQFLSLLHIIQHYLTSRTSFTSILTSSTHQIVEKNVFKNLPLVAYRRCKNISDILVRAQLTEDPDSSNSRVNPCSFPVPGSLYHLSLHRTWPHSIYFLFHRWNVPYQISYNLYYFQCYLHDSMSPM